MYVYDIIISINYFKRELLWNLMKNYKNCESTRVLLKKNLQSCFLFRVPQFQNGNLGVPKLKDTTLKPTLTLLPNNTHLEVKPYETPYILRI